MPEAKAKTGGGSVSSFPDLNPCAGCSCGPILIVLLVLASLVLL